jgi:hypothetical protein
VKDAVVKYKNQSFTVGVIEDSHYFQTNKRGSHYAPVYDDRAFDYLAYRVKRRIHNRFDNRIVNAGPPRTGKTTISVTWARKIDPDFPVENVSFRLADFRKTLSSLPPADPEHDKYPLAILDESGVDLYAKDWATRLVKDMSKVFQICGKKRLTMFLNLPHRNLLTKDMRDEMHFWINTQTMEEYRGFAAVREAEPSDWYSPYWKPLFGLVFDEIKDKWWSEYEKRKDEFIEEYTSQETVLTPVRIQKLMSQRDKCIAELRRRGVTLREIENISGLHTSGISRIEGGKRRNQPSAATDVGGVTLTTSTKDARFQANP